MTQATAEPDVVLTPATWALVSDERGDGFVMATAVGLALHVHVGSPGQDSPSAARHAGGLVTALLDATGSVVVETTTAPPALLVSRDGTRLLSAVPGQERPTRMQPGDRLVLCSAAELDGAPEGLLNLLRCVAGDLLTMSPEDLLGDVLAGVESGAATVIARTCLDRTVSPTGEDLP